MHIADFDAGMLGANGVVAGGIPIAVGAAQGLRLLGSDAVVACFFGDGAVNRGPFLEGLNWAALFRLPVLFVCEDNGVAAFTRAESTTAGPGVAARAEALGVPAEAVDGNSAAAVDEAAGRLVREIRAGGGPRLLHARTTRLSGHTSTDAAAWRTAEEVAGLRARDPVAALEGELLRQGVAAEALAAVRKEAEAEMQEAREAARAAPGPTSPRPGPTCRTAARRCPPDAGGDLGGGDAPRPDPGDAARRARLGARRGRGAGRPVRPVPRRAGGIRRRPRRVHADLGERPSWAPASAPRWSARAR